MIRQRARLVKWVRRSFFLPWATGCRLFDELTDNRARRGRRHTVESVVTMVLLALCMGKFSLMRMEGACQEMGSVVRRMCGVVGRISDNTFGRILARLRWQELQLRLWWQVRAFRERKQLEHDCLPIPTLALDGKTAASGTKKMSRFAKRQVHKDKDDSGEVTETRTYYTLHLMRAVLTSCRQKLCVWQHPVRSKANEITGAKTMLRQLFKLDKGMHLFQLVTFDAMMMGYPLTLMISKAGRHWLSVLKDNQPDLLAAAQNWYRPMPDDIAEYTSGRVKEHHFRKVYRIWRTGHMAGWVTREHTWTHLQQVWCVEVIRYVRADNGRGKKAKLVEHDRTVRYCATSLPVGQFTAAQCLELVLSHWAIEDDCFNAVDVMWEEDTHKHFTTGEATLNLSFLRMMAYNLVQMKRRKKEKTKTWDGKSVWETWDTAFSLFLVTLQQYYPAQIVIQERMLQTNN
ncbi:MAG: ISAs1 family transposase [Proteobacteria bacterium]|nr:ISAs1 family transposase [Pseudomonadota bacterium]